MAKTTILFATALIVLGLVGYLGISTGPAGPSTEPATTPAVEAESGEPKAEVAPKRSVTALIPAFVGAAMLLCGVLALNEGMRMHAMHGAVLVGLLGAFAGAGRGFMGLGKFLSGDPSLNTRSFIFVWLMAAICAVFVAFCVRSFIEARKQRQLAESNGPQAS